MTTDGPARPQAASLLEKYFGAEDEEEDAKVLPGQGAEGFVFGIQHPASGMGLPFADAVGAGMGAAMGMGADMYSEGMAAHLALRQRQVGTAQGISGRGAPSGTGGAWAVLAAPPWQAAAAAASAGATLAARPGARASNVRARIGVVPRAVTSPAMSAASAKLLGTSAHAHAHAQWG